MPGSRWTSDGFGIQGAGSLDTLVNAYIECVNRFKGDATKGSRMTRVCFISRVRPDRLDDYRSRHAAVWPEMLEALRDTGWRDYSLFLAPDGLLVGYLAAYAAKALVDGDIKGEEGDSFEAGKLGEYKVGPDNTVLLGDPFVFDAKNIDQFKF